MNSEEDARHLTADFVADRVRLLPAELARGYRLGCVDDRAVVKLAEDALKRGASELPAMEQLALLLADELDRVPALLTEIEAAASRTNVDPTRVWLFLVLARIYERRGISTDPMAEIEAVYADFGYPDEMEGFVPFLPAPKGEPSSREATEERWRAYLDRRADEYSTRPARSGS